MAPEPGRLGAASLAVTDADTAIALSSGEVPVLGTPRVIALCEEATLNALNGCMEAGQTSVGMRVQVDHLAPTGVGHTVRAEATLKRVEGRRLTFKVAVRDERGLVAAGTVTRVVVDTERFMDRTR